MHVDTLYITQTKQERGKKKETLGILGIIEE